MKRIITSAGLVVLGVATAQSAYAQAAADKPWSVAATLRGFYDDNWNTRAKPSDQDSYGVEISPAVGLNLQLEQTTIGLGYVYGLRYYENRPENKADHSHQANAKLSHAFTERFKVDLSDSFVVAQEPEILETPGAPFTSLLRSEGDNIRNTAVGSATVGLAEKLDTVLMYSNTFFDYEARGVNSRSALLDRVEHLFTSNLRWQALPKTVGVFGYQYQIVDYTSSDLLTIPGGTVSPDSRDNSSHFVYAGADQSISDTLNASIRAGVQITDYDDQARDNKVGPYVDGNLTWLYAEGSYALLGVRHSRTPTDVAAGTVDAESSVIYTSLNHKIFGGLTAGLLGQFQHVTFEGGGADDESDNLMLAGVNVAYKFNPLLSLEGGYNYDRLDSDLAGRSFTRNRVYVGIRATY